MQSFHEHMRFYRNEHSTLGCKITHMFGVPIIAASIPVLFFDWKVGLGLYVFGWTLQFIGHYVFEKNKPVFLSDIKNPLTYVSALAFVTEEWLKLLTGKPLVDGAPPRTTTAKG